MRQRDLPSNASAPRRPHFARFPPRRVRAASATRSSYIDYLKAVQCRSLKNI
eukprot:NODE_9557_length_336_cov_176.583630.p2 GENE.NODE_9557_length_336_cov_176.583630~~NODE_9557_length_336_cov_176.583630.p2  ORF type:complete len:52 (+),score=1.20 NODE_9557_length_336_cov_176.583630:146-301(+)